jgi:hypothetical protein
MSVTIFIESVATGVFTASCWASGSEVEAFRVEGYEAAQAALVAHKAECSECECYGCYLSAVVDIEGAPEVNLANGNARRLGEVLGFDFGDELVGSCDPDALLGAVLPFIALDHAPVIPEQVEKVENGPTVVISEFDAANYLTRIADLCVEAKRLGRTILWG